MVNVLLAENADNAEILIIQKRLLLKYFLCVSFAINFEDLAVKFFLFGNTGITNSLKEYNLCAYVSMWLAFTKI